MMGPMKSHHYANSDECHVYPVCVLLLFVEARGDAVVTPDTSNSSSIVCAATACWFGKTWP